MHRTAAQIVDLANRTAGRSNSFHVRPETSVLGVEALRLLAREQGIQGWRSAYQIAVWDAGKTAIIERLAEASNWAVAQAAFRAAVAERPGLWVT